LKPLRRRIHARELLDDGAVDPGALEASLDDVAAVNRWLGGTRAVLLGIDELIGQSNDAHILDVGCGVADLPLAIVRNAQQRQLRRLVTAIDLHGATTAIARRRTEANPAIGVLRANALTLPFADGTFDVALLSLTLHHLESDQLVPAVRELARVARRGVVVNELHRTRLNYLGARFLAATLWRRRPITRHDGPLSVLRAFTPEELLTIGAAAGLRGARVRRRVFSRVVLIGEKPKRAAAASTV
jgi:SAM-dependent methyltransferase